MPVSFLSKLKLCPTLHIGFNHLIFVASPYINTVMNYCLSGFLDPMFFMDPDVDPALDPDPTLDPSSLCRNSQIY